MQLRFVFDPPRQPLDLFMIHEMVKRVWTCKLKTHFLNPYAHCTVLRDVSKYLGSTCEEKRRKKQLEIMLNVWIVIENICLTNLVLQSESSEVGDSPYDWGIHEFMHSTIWWLIMTVLMWVFHLMISYSTEEMKKHLGKFKKWFFYMF